MMSILRRLMWLGVILFGGILALGIVEAWGKVEQAKVKQAEIEARAVLTLQVESWNGGGLVGFMTGYWQNDDLTFYSGGTVTKGWQATFDRYRKRYQADGKEMGKLTFEDLQVDVLTVDAAVVRGRWKVVTSKETASGLFTLLMRRIDGKWVITHDHTSAADPPKPQ